LKTLSKTRLSVRADASKALHKSYHEVVSTLTEIGSDEGQTKDVRSEADSIVEKLKTLELVIMVCIWNCILMKFNAISEKLKKKTSKNLEKVGMSFSSLETFLTTLREEKEFKNFEMEAIKMCLSNVCKKI
jgi:uncharacterized protein (UPF0147 family)